MKINLQRTNHRFFILNTNNDTLDLNILVKKVKVNVKQSRYRPNWPRGWIDYPFVTPALEGGGWSAPLPGRFTPWKDPVPIVQEVRWAPGPVWTCAKNLAPTGIRSPDRPAAIPTELPGPQIY
jgi:hypothetical protein